MLRTRLQQHAAYRKCLANFAKATNRTHKIRLQTRPTRIESDPYTSGEQLSRCGMCSWHERVSPEDLPAGAQCSPYHYHNSPKVPVPECACKDHEFNRPCVDVVVAQQFMNATLGRRLLAIPRACPEESPMITPRPDVGSCTLQQVCAELATVVLFIERPGRSVWRRVEG